MCGLPSFPVADHTIMMNFIEIQYLNKRFLWQRVLRIIVYVYGNFEYI